MIEREVVAGYTIDGPESRDIDDAIHVTRNPNGWVVLVHIADVAAGLPADSALARAARNRGFTRYLPGSRTRPMLPRRLSEDRLSLLPGQTRQTLTFHIVLDRELRPAQVEIHPTLLTSSARLTYDPTQDKDVPPGVVASLIAATELSRQLLALRRSRGALAIYDAMEARREHPREQSRHSERHVIIQELMILTNHLVGQWLAERKAVAMYRVHPGPPEDAERQSLRAALAGLYGPNIAAAAAPDPMHRLGRASYSAQAGEHFGLALRVYTQVTSPIRRYADLANHRVIRSLLFGEPMPDPAGADALATELNQLREDDEEAQRERHKRAAYARALRQHKEGKLTTIDDGTFRNLATLLARQGTIDDNFAREFARRVSRLQLPDLYPVIFEGPESGRQSAAYSPVRAAISTRLAAEPFMAVSLLTMAEQKEAIAALRFDVMPAAIGSVAQASMARDSGRVYGPMTTGANGQEARQAAASALVRVLIGAEVVPDVPSTPMQPQPQPAPTPRPVPAVADGPSPISRLGEMAQNKRVPPPTYQYTQQGSPHQPMFACTCSFGGVQTEGHGSTKRDAKREAAAAMVTRLRNV